MTLMASPVLPFFWLTPSLLDFLLFCSIGMIGGISQYWTTQALYYALAAAVSPFNYTALVRSLMIGFVVWNELPTLPTVVGSAVVTLTGLYLLRHEAFRRGPLRRAPSGRPAC